MSRVINPGAEEMIDKIIPCLDHGFVRLVDYMGDDSAISEAARVSYQKGTRQISEDKHLIRYMMRHGHGSPFEMVEFKFHAKMPIFVARHWIRYRTANVNEMSMRYSLPTDDSYVPEAKEVRRQSKTNKQGRADEELPLEITEMVRGRMEQHNQASLDLYKVFQGEDIARELARSVLPVGSYTEWYWKNDLRNIFNFLKQRLDSHAQPEIRVYAEAIASVVKSAVPIAFEAFEDYGLNAKTFSGLEMNALELILRGFDPKWAAQEQGLKGRELGEFLDKLPN